MRVIVSRSHAFAHPDRESEEVKLPIEGVDNCCLRLVQGKSKSLKYMLQHCHSLARLTSSAKYDDIVRIADDAGTYPLLQVSPLPYPVQYMQVEIGQ